MLACSPSPWTLSMSFYVLWNQLHLRPTHTNITPSGPWPNTWPFPWGPRSPEFLMGVLPTHPFWTTFHWHCFTKPYTVLWLKQRSQLDWNNTMFPPLVKVYHSTSAVFSCAYHSLQFALLFLICFTVYISGLYNVFTRLSLCFVILYYAFTMQSF